MDWSVCRSFEPWVRKFGRAGYSSLVIRLDPEGAKEHILGEGKTPTSSAIIKLLESGEHRSHLSFPTLES